jgi:hypothetical protein
MADESGLIRNRRYIVWDSEKASLNKLLLLLYIHTSASLTRQSVVCGNYFVNTDLTVSTITVYEPRDWISILRSNFVTSFFTECRASLWPSEPCVQWGSLPERKGYRSMAVTNHIHPMLRPRLCGATLSRPQYTFTAWFVDIGSFMGCPKSIYTLHT